MKRLVAWLNERVLLGRLLRCSLFRSPLAVSAPAERRTLVRKIAIRQGGDLHYSSGSKSSKQFPGMYPTCGKIVISGPTKSIDERASVSDLTIASEERFGESIAINFISRPSSIALKRGFDRHQQPASTVSP